MALNGLFCADVPLRNYSLTSQRSNVFWRRASVSPHGAVNGAIAWSRCLCAAGKASVLWSLASVESNFQ